MSREAAEREAIVAEALTWLGTPYHPEARLKGVGADCLTFLAGVTENVGLTPHIDLPRYAPDQNLHRGDETYLDGLLEYCVEVPPPPERTPLPGDIMLVKFGRIFFHGALVLDWPMIIHAFAGRRLSRENAEQAPYLNFVGERGPDRGRRRPRKFFTLKGWS